MAGQVEITTVEIANLLKQKPETKPPERFLAIQIQEGIIKTALWQIDAGQPQVISYGSLQSYTDAESLPQAVDISLSHALANEATDDLDRVLLGVPESWFKDNSLSSEYKNTISNLVKQLDLKPVGLVSLTDALITHLKQKEGIPPSVIIVEAGDTKVNISVVRLGLVKGREEVDRSADLASDVAEALARIDADQLPSRFLVINGNDPDIEQQLTSYLWMDKFPFLHLPKVEIPDPHFSIEAIALSGGSEAARSLGLEISVQPPPAKGEDLNEVEEEGVSVSETTDEQINELTDQLPGFVIDQDIAASPTPVAEDSSLPHTPIPIPQFKLPKPSFSRPQFRLPTFPTLPRLPQLSLPRSRKALILIPLSLILLTVAVYALFLFVLNSARIDVTVTPYKLNKSLPIAIASSPDSTLPTLNATPQTFEIIKSGSLPTTGEAVVGEKATGEVVIFNKTNAAKTLPKGTVLATTNNLKFLTDSSVEVASPSSTPSGDGITFGRANVTITAARIGAESNLPSNTSLSVAAFPLSSLEAKVITGLTGGSSRTVRAVSEGDLEKLERQVMDEINQEAAQKVESSGDLQAVPTSDTEITKKTFNKGVGEEADSLSLEVSATVTVLRYHPAELKSLIAGQITSEVPTGYSFSPEALSVSLSDVQTADGRTTATAKVEGGFLPQLDLERYKDQIKGRSVPAAKQLLEGIIGYQGSVFQITYALPLMAERLPFNARQIDLNLIPAQ